MSRTAVATQSLVKYETPILVSTMQKGSKSPKKKKPVKTVGAVGKEEEEDAEDALNRILPPKESNQEGQLWVEFVSTTPATPADVIKLQEDLDRTLQTRQARETGICPIREEVYGQCFDELIRQVTLICTERGILLHRVREEIRMTIQAYQTLYESSIAFGMRKTLQAEQRRAEMEAATKTLTRECDDLQNEVDELEAEIKDIEEKEMQRKESDDRTHKEEVEFKKKANNHLKDQLEGLLAAPKR